MQLKIGEQARPSKTKKLMSEQLTAVVAEKKGGRSTKHTGLARVSCSIKANDAITSKSASMTIARNVNFTRLLTEHDEAQLLNTLDVLMEILL